MSEFHIHFTHVAIPRKEGAYSYEREPSKDEKDQWHAMLTAQLKAAFDALNTVPVNASKNLTFSLTVKQ